jgi:catechol 2,3-dioxygenase-like lactoylglutathione lyase family enzyme
MPETPTISLSHVAVCTSDIERSARFYLEALGFVLDHYVDIGPPFDILSELPGFTGRAGFFTLGGVRIELLSFNPEVIGPRERRPMNQLGLTHLSFRVSDIDAVAQRIVDFGGVVLADTRVEAPHVKMIFCTDPDGTRIELMQELSNTV